MSTFESHLSAARQARAAAPATRAAQASSHHDEYIKPFDDLRNAGRKVAQRASAVGFPYNLSLGTRRQQESKNRFTGRIRYGQWLPTSVLYTGWDVFQISTGSPSSEPSLRTYNNGSGASFYTGALLVRDGSLVCYTSDSFHRYSPPEPLIVKPSDVTTIAAADVSSPGQFPGSWGHSMVRELTGTNMEKSERVLASLAVFAVEKLGL